MASEIIVINSADNGAWRSDIPKGTKVPVPGHDDIMVSTRSRRLQDRSLRSRKGGRGDQVRPRHRQVKEDVKRGQWIHLHNMIIIEEER